jgi:hypothetical protein
MGRGPKYLFSGFMICGLCGARMIIVSGDGKRAYVKYGCPSHRYRGVCTNFSTDCLPELSILLRSLLLLSIFRNDCSVGLDDRLAEMNQPRELSLSLDELREFLCHQVAEISRLLHGDVEIARQAMAKHIEQLILTPKEAPGPLLEAFGDVELFNVLGDWETRRRCASVMVARDGIGYRYAPQARG